MELRAKRALLMVTAAAMLAACQLFVTKGTMPPPGPNGQLDASSMPDFIAVAGRDAGIAGYARKEDVLGTQDLAFPVYGEDLQTVVGQVVPGKGFIPVGVDPNSVPDIPVVVGPSEQTPADGSKVVIYVRNDAPTILYDAVLVDGTITDSGGFWGQNMGAGCYSMPVGSQLVVLDRAPTEPGSSVARVLYTRSSEPDPISLWIAVSRDGTITQGVGVPAWWGSPQSC